MMAKQIPIGPGTRVSLKFSILLMGGEIVDTTGSTPAEFCVGDGSLLPGFEKAMFGLQAGATERLQIPASQAFGEHQEANVQRLRREQFPVNMDLAEGLMMSFADKNDAELPGVIKKIQGESIEIDFNHPLSGKDLIFEVDIVSVEQVSNEIIRVSE
ncbi:MAG: FKBP-type peptidyl-prolyl cis-trans isomerase SlpA [Candidatus Pseudothioglobus sp.]